MSLVLIAGSPPRSHAGGEWRCGTQSSLKLQRGLDQPGGAYITSRGTLRVLIVFASFPDDNNVHPFWPAHQPPSFINQFIDPDTLVNSGYRHNLTNYFHQMSLGEFHVVGQAVWLEGARPSTDYIGDDNIGAANRDFLRDVAVPRVDFSTYDQWTRDAPYVHRNVPDSTVDMIVLVWRGVYLNIEGSPFWGEASLGRYGSLPANGGKWIHLGFPEYANHERGSGVTCQYGYAQDAFQSMQTMVHEIGHWLLGGQHPYSVNGADRHSFWGILGGGQVAASCANSYERERLGWITLPEIQPDANVALTDYLRTGAAYKYHPVNGYPYEYFYIENHQKLSVFDDVTRNPVDKGVWILHQASPYANIDNLRIKPSDGNWDWENPGVTTRCFTQELPIFRRGDPRVGGGLSHRDMIPTLSRGFHWMYVNKDLSGLLNCGAFVLGEMFEGAFGIRSSSMFSPYSNPDSRSWENQPTPFCLEIIDDVNGVITLRFHSNPLDGSPARRYLGTHPTAPDTSRGSVSLAWGAQWTGGQPLETDVSWSELERQVGNGIWTRVYQGPSTSWSDRSIHYDSSGAIPVLFRVRVHDTQGKSSTWSNVFHTATEEANGIGEHIDAAGGMALRYHLGSNFPNPFNPVTSFEFSVPSGRDLAGGGRVPSSGLVTLKVFDFLGREVATLVNEVKQPGTYTMQWDASDVASGVYFYRLVAYPVGQEAISLSVKKMLLTR